MGEGIFVFYMAVMAQLSYLQLENCFPSIKGDMNSVICFEFYIEVVFYVFSLMLLTLMKNFLVVFVCIFVLLFSLVGSQVESECKTLKEAFESKQSKRDTSNFLSGNSFNKEKPQDLVQKPKIH